jgi:hypothetical protein
MSCLPHVEERREFLDLECYRFYFRFWAIIYVALLSEGLNGSGGGYGICFCWLASLLLIKGPIALLN